MTTNPRRGEPERAAGDAPGTAIAATKPRWELLQDLAITYAGIALIGLVDGLSDVESHVSLSYVFPVAWATWRISPRAGILAAIVATVFDTLIDLHLARFAPNVLPIVWNVLVEAALLSTGAWVVHRLHQATISELALLARLSEVHGRLKSVYASLDREVQGVADIQRSLLPSTIPPVLGYRIAVHYAASARAGGDYYDLLPQPAARMGFLVADVSGHGPSAAVIMAMARVLVHGDREAQRSPDRLLGAMNAGLVENILLDHFVTACYAVLDPTSGTVEFALAGHPLPMRVRAATGEVADVGVPEGPPLGLAPGAAYRCQTVSLDPGDTLVLHTDGLTEARSSSGELLGEEGVMRTLSDSARLDAPTLLARLIETLRVHLDGAPSQDDVTILVVQREPAS